MGLCSRQKGGETSRGPQPTLPADARGTDRAMGFKKAPEGGTGQAAVNWHTHGAC